MAAKKRSKTAGRRQKAAKVRDLTEGRGLDAKGGDMKSEAQIQAALSSMVSEVIKNFGGALQTAARN